MVMFILYYLYSNINLLERISPYFLNGVQVFGVIVGEAVVFLALIALVYRRQEI